MRGALPPSLSGPAALRGCGGETLASQPETVRQDLSQIKGTRGIHSQHEGSPWRKPTGLLSGFSLKCQSFNHNPKLRGWQQTPFL